jgi:hypothetical protein
MEMAGASITLMEVDDELAAWFDHPAQTPFLCRWPKVNARLDEAAVTAAVARIRR